MIKMKKTKDQQAPYLKLQKWRQKKIQKWEKAKIQLKMGNFLTKMDQTQKMRAFRRTN